MIDWLSKLLLAWIPLFVAIDPVGVVPLFLGVTKEITRERRQRLAHQATWTALAVTVGFMVLGRMVFAALGITIADFQIAGGLILLVLAARDLVGSDLLPSGPADDLGVVPLGMPLIAGPATLTTVLLLMNTVGVGFTLLALLINLALVGVTFRFCEHLQRWLGLTGLRAVSKITSLLLAAIAVSMIRRGWHQPF